MTKILTLTVGIVLAILVSANNAAQAQGRVTDVVIF